MVSTIDGIGSDAALPLEAIWTSVKDALSRELSPTTFNTWIERLKPCFNESNILSLEAPNHFFRSFIEKTYGRDISQAISRISQSLGLPAELHPIVDFCAPSLGPGKAAEGEEGCRACRAESGQPESGPEKRAEGDLISPPQPCDKHLAFDPRLCFETFVVGTQNSLAYHAAKAVAEDSSLGAGILFITGDPGLGKSHLAQALGQRFLGSRHKATVMYLTFEDYTNELVLNINRKTMEEFKRKYREKCDLLMLEEAAFLKDKLHIQQELCYTLDNLINNGKRVVITSTKPLQSIS
ncbi:MAG: ATP-binding protein, partial [Deltaproteobacteria bacterium]|nr:ATP-binding protein [Deltaproteobacteria bacterium]